MPQVYKKAGLLMLIIVLVGSLYAQDIHFTNFRMAPVSFNPANTGAFLGTYRISGIYRDQWRSIDNSKPYATPFISAEVNIKGGLLSKTDWLSGAMSFLIDNAGTNRSKNNLRAINVGYHYSLDDDYKNVVSLGVSYGTITYGFNTLNLILPGDLDGSTREPIGNPDQNGDVKRNLTNIDIGLAYKTQLNDAGDLLRFGLTAAHITNPKNSLVTSDSLNMDDTRIGRRMTFTGEASFKSGEKLRINPALLFQSKGGATELAIQSTADYLLNAEKQMVVTGGLGYRLGDALELIGGIQLKDVKVVLSYDVTTSGIARAGGGAFEIAVGYVGNIFKKPKVKPVIFCPQL